MTNPSHPSAKSVAPCPRCGRALTVCPIPDGGMGWCDRCLGIWLDNRACQALVGDRISEAGREKISWVTQQNRTPAPAPAGQGYRRPEAVGAPDEAVACPVCRGALRSFVTDPSRHGARVALDVCPAHGTWFDHGEAWGLLQALALKSAALDLELANDANERAWDRRNAAFNAFVAGAVAGTARGIRD